MKKENLLRATKYLESWADFNFPFSRMPGLVIALQEGDKIVFQKAWGMANVERKIRMRTNHLFRIASHSKMFTAVSIMQLVEKGKIRLNEPLVTYLPWLKEAKDNRYRKITVRQVMEHAAGIIRDGLDSNYWDLQAPFPTREKLIRDFKSTKLVFNPNKQFKYSNYGFSLLGLLIEEVSGMSYADYLKKNIFTPLRMRNAGADIDGVDKSRFPVPYSRENKALKRSPLKNPSSRGMAAATGVYASAEDLCKFTRIFYTKNKVISEKSIREITRMHWHTDKKDATKLYGLGFDRRKIGSKWYVGHGGGFPGFITRTMIDRKDKITLVVLKNCLYGADFTASTLTILQFFENMNISSSTKKADVYEGRYENLWSILDIINRGDKLIAFSPIGWDTPKDAQELKKIGKDKYLITRADSFFSPGELVKFMHKNGAIRSVIYAGAKASKV